MKKRILLTLAIIAMLVCVFAVSVSAAEYVDDAGIKYVTNSDGKTAYVADSRSTFIGPEAIIAEKITIEGVEYTVTSVANNFLNENQTVEVIYFPKTITSIGNSTYRKSTSLKYVYIDFENIVSIGELGLTTGSHSGNYNDVRTDIVFYATSEYGKEAPQQTTVASFDSAITIGAAACQGLNVDRLILGENLTNISIQTFRGARISSLLIKDSDITAIGNYTFDICDNLKTIRVEADVASIGASAFSGCKAVTEICIDMSTVTQIGGNAFVMAQKYDAGNTRTQWYNLQGEKIVDLYNVTSIGSRGFGSSNLGSAEKIIWPRALKQNDFGSTADSSCFRNCNISGTYYLNVADGYSFTLDNWAVRGNNFDTIIIGNNVSKILGRPWNGSKNVQTVVFLSPNIDVESNELFKDMGSNITLYHNGLVTNTEFSQTNEIQISSGSAVNYGACGIYASVVVSNETVVFDKTNHDYVLVDYDNTYCPINTMGNYDCSYCEATKQQANEGTSPVKDGHVYDIIKSVKYDDGFLSKGDKVVACECTLEKAEKIDAIFSFKGYSTEQNGTSMCVGYIICEDSLNDYNSCNDALVFGAVASKEAGSVLTVDDGKIVGSGKTVVAPVTSVYSSFDFILSGFGKGQETIALAVCAYVYDGESISYFTSSESEVPTMITLQEVIEREKTPPVVE